MKTGGELQFVSDFGFKQVVTKVLSATPHVMKAGAASAG